MLTGVAGTAQSRSKVNGRPARIRPSAASVVDWEIELDAPKEGTLTASSTDRSGNPEKLAHRVGISR